MGTGLTSPTCAPSRAAEDLALVKMAADVAGVAAPAVAVEVEVLIAGSGRELAIAALVDHTRGRVMAQPTVGMIRT